MKKSGHKRKKDGRRFNGGHRRGAGRPPGVRWLLANAKFTYNQALMYAPIVIKEYRHGQRRRVKTTLEKLVMDRLEELAIGGSHTWWKRYERFLDRMERATTYRKLADKLFIEYTNLLRRDPQFHLLLRTQVVSQKPVRIRDRDTERSIKQFKRLTREEKRREKVRLQVKQTEQTEKEIIEQPRRRTPAQIEREKKLVYKNERDFYIDENGRKVWSEQAARMKNAIGMQKYFSNREKLEKYRRGERPRIEE